MVTVESQDYLKAWASKILDIPLAYDSQCIGNVLNDELRAVAVYCNFEGKSCQVHIASSGSHWMTRDFLKAIFDYPFNKLKLKVIIGAVPGNNEKALKLDRHLGFEEIANIADAHKDGNLVLLTMRPEQCKWLKLGVGNGC